MTDTSNRYYFLEEKTKTIFHCVKFPKNTGFVYLGMSGNPRPKAAAAAFMKQGRCLTGCKVKEYIQD